MTLGFAWIPLAGAVAALVLIAIGVVRASRALLSLNERLRAYDDLPIFHAIERTQFRVAAVTQRFGELDALLERARLAVEQIRVQLSRLRSVFAPLSRRRKSPES